MRLQGVGCGLIAFGAVPVAVEFRDNLDFTGGRLVVSINHLLKAGHAQHARVGLFEVEHQHLAAGIAERGDHRLAG